MMHINHEECFSEGTVLHIVIQLVHTTDFFKIFDRIMGFLKSILQSQIFSLTIWFYISSETFLMYLVEQWVFSLMNGDTKLVTINRQYYNGDVSFMAYIILCKAFRHC